MPRTKVPRNIGNNKRARENANELEEITRDFEIDVENSNQMLKSELNMALREIEASFEAIKRSIPPHVLAMKIKDVRQLNDLNDKVIEEKMTNLNVTVKETVQRADEGDVTSASEYGSRNKSIHNVSVVASLTKTKLRRRSKSATNLASTITPGPRAMMSVVKGRTPMVQQPLSTHASRSKYRTPMSTALRAKAMSADRINTITPKVNPANPFSMMRHPRAGEAVFSVTGSPIVTSHVVEHTANVNIPIANGILSLRPQMMDASNLDGSFLSKIDPTTFNHLRTLKANLDIVMAGFSRKFHH